MKAIVF